MNWQDFLNGYFGLINKFLPKPHLIPTIGFDIGTSSIKAVEIKNVNGALGIERWSLEPIEGGDVKGALKRLTSRLNIKDQVPIASISGKGTLIRYIDMPRMNIDDLRKSIVYEIDKYFPFDPQSIYTDCYIIDPQGKDKKMSVLVVAAKKELVDDRIKLFKEAGMELTNVTTNSIATANAFRRLVKDQMPAGARAILDIGGSVSNLMILDKNQAPRFTRDIFIGSQDFSKQIANTLGVDMAKAEELKVSPGARAAEISKACEATLDNLIGEMHLSFDYFITEKNLSVEGLYLVGGGALLKGIDEAIEKNLNMPVKIWDPLSGLNISEQASSTAIQSYSSQLGVAVGLALAKV